MVDLRAKKPKFLVVPVVSGVPPISCEFPDEMLQDIQQYLGQMVAVYGEGWRHSREIFPYRMRANKIQPISGENTALYDLCGICPDFGGGRPSEEIVREMRDEWDD